jgi:hypothetical protein
MERIPYLKHSIMKKNVNITATFDCPELVESIAEELAAMRYHSGFADAIVPGKCKAIETSSVETYVTGNMEIIFGSSRNINMPFITCFLFSCTREKNDDYKLDWAVSLS